MTFPTNKEDKYRLTNQIVKRIPTYKSKDFRDEKKKLCACETKLYRLKFKYNYMFKSTLLFKQML